MPLSAPTHMRLSARSLAKAGLRGLLGGWISGRLKPLPFALLFPLALTATLLSGSTFVQALGNPAMFEPRSVAAAGQAVSMLPSGLAWVWTLAGLLAVSVAAFANVIAKRIRDMGIPGGLATCMLAIIYHVLISGGSTLMWVTNGFIFALLVALLAIPTDHLEAGSGRPRPGGST